MILSVLFYLVLQGAYNTETIHVSVAVVANENDAEMKDVADLLSTVTYQNESLYDVVWVDDAEAMNLLNKGEVSGILYQKDGKIAVKLASNGLKETMITEFVHQYEVNRQLILSAIERGMSGEEAVKLVAKDDSISFQPTVEKNPGALHFLPSLVWFVCMVAFMASNP